MLLCGCFLWKLITVVVSFNFIMKFPSGHVGSSVPCGACHSKQTCLPLCLGAGIRTRPSEKQLD